MSTPNPEVESDLPVDANPITELKSSDYDKPIAEKLSDKNESTDINSNNETYQDDFEANAYSGAKLNDSSEDMGDELSRLESNAQISRTLSRRITGSESFYSDAQKSNEPMPKMGGGRDYPPPLIADRTAYQVQFDGPDDPTHPQNWSSAEKFIICCIACFSAFSIAVGSALFSQAQLDLMEIYHIGWTVASLTTSLFVFGFASGPIIWGPLSELYGRRLPLIISSIGYVCFCFGVATAKDIQTIMLCRFFAGFVGAAPLVVAPAILADIFNTKQRGPAISIFAMALFGGPMIAPILGGYTVRNTSLGWRWTGYFIAIIASASLVLTVFFLKETYHALILSEKAEKLRRRTGNWGIYAPHDEFKLSLKEICEKNLTRPIIMLFTEPILFLVTLYNAFIYGMLYLFLTAIPLIFEGTYLWKPGNAELPYLSMFLGTLVGGLVSIAFEVRFNKIMDKNRGIPVPEERLVSMMAGAVLFVVGIFWLGWSGGFGTKVHWIVPTLGAFPVGMGLILIFLPCLNYIIDCYLIYAASAIAGNTFLRSAFGAAFPLFAKQMFDNMKIKWAATLIGCLSAAMLPVPFLFYKYGARLRKMSKYSMDLELIYGAGGAASH
ncbi:major facilitator superfamily domain-containing protein [Scheffersomyces coipomensis]|uniref:major facilitator superfamily domain-containing protein n=1 Tax=Scheffersomyces coipomensis TaxID=1788519 RepID=UPI00315D1B03